MKPHPSFQILLNLSAQNWRLFVHSTIGVIAFFVMPWSAEYTVVIFKSLVSRKEMYSWWWFLSSGSTYLCTDLCKNMKSTWNIHELSRLWIIMTDYDQISSDYLIFENIKFWSSRSDSLRLVQRQVSHAMQNLQAAGESPSSCWGDSAPVRKVSFNALLLCRW